MRGTIARLLVVMAVAIPSLALAGPALAQYPPGNETDTTPDASFACEGLVPDGTATCSIGGWKAGSEVSVSVTASGDAQAMPPLATVGLVLAQAAQPVFADTLTADDTGFISYSFDVPADADTLAFTHTGIGIDGTPITHTAVLDAAPASSGDGADGAADDGLASTGEMVSLLLLAAVLAIGVGALAVRRGRRHGEVDTGAGA